MTMNHNGTIDYTRIEKYKWIKDSDLRLNIIVYSFALFFLIISFSGNIEIIFPTILIIVPIITIFTFMGQQLIRKKYISIEKRFSQAIFASSVYLDKGLTEFNTELYEQLKPFEDEIEYAETRAILFLLGYAKVTFQDPINYPDLENTTGFLKKIKSLLQRLSQALGQGAYSDAYDIIGDLLIKLDTITRVRKDKSTNPDKTLNSFSEKLIEISNFVKDINSGEAKWACESALKTIKYNQSKSIENKWKVIILRWIYINLHNFDLPTKKIYEKGIFFSSSYELLAFDIARARIAFDAKDWPILQEVISESFNKHRIIPKFIIQRSLRNIY